MELRRELNRKGVPYTEYSQMGLSSGDAVLTHPKYAGMHVYGRTSCRLYTPSVKLRSRIGFSRMEPLSQSWMNYVLARRSESSQIARSTNRMKNCSTSLKGLLAREGRLSLRL